MALSVAPLDQLEICYQFMPFLQLNLSDNLRGSLLMVIAMAGFAVNDGFIKFVGQNLPLGEILLIRGLFATALVAVMAKLLGQLRPLSAVMTKVMLLRTAGDIIATVSFLTALFNIPFANVSAVLQALPLVVTLGAAVFFGEKIGWRRMSAILVGLLGVLLIIRPGFEGFSVFSLYSLMAVAGSTIRDLASRRLPAEIPSLFASLVNITGVTVLGGLIALFQEWQPVEASQYAAMAAASVFLVIAIFGVTAAMRIGEVGFVSPFRYFVLLFSILIGMMFFAEIPDTITIIGSLIVVASGIYTLYRERIVRKQMITAPPTRS